ncbi:MULTISPECIES: DUF3221 domain-containing protein [Cytobacillus]|uniref:DUF3221 domain-containing protein n=1 Tax=Cytobacillus stercorigallinarum TaxID=2762240 RepID=A0ABR8QTN8_9BACI|nr:DUF3221 domain-containing protein [Cytobacillus stercorigallinarum]MBD7938863.1 DUF3221 domain-containing protein [Cytobacillus stercorigallinarum]
MKSNKIPKTIFNIGNFLLILIGIWIFSEISNNISIKGRQPTDIGHVVFFQGITYFVKGEDIKTSDFEVFSHEDIMFSRKFEEVSIFDDSGIKLLGKGIKNGDKVAIWYDVVLESYPARIKLIQIEKRD